MKEGKHKAENKKENTSSASVGIIVNPAAGSDIRRIAALGTVFGAQEKVNVVQRILVGLSATGVEHVYLMPDAFGIGKMALSDTLLRLTGLDGRVSFLDMLARNEPLDSMDAAWQMQDLGVRCIIVLGGDGTNRVVAKRCGDTPILPVSAGTNNVIPYSVEGTIAGMAAGFISLHPEVLERVAYRSKKLEICRDGEAPDIALVDIAVVKGNVAGAGAIWEPNALREVILTRGSPFTTGVSSLGGFLFPISPIESRGLYFRLGEPKICSVTVPLAPGLIVSLGVEELRRLSINDSVTVCGDKVLALDGERHIILRRGQCAHIYLRDDGPWFVDVFRALWEGVSQRAFSHNPLGLQECYVDPIDHHGLFELGEEPCD